MLVIVDQYEVRLVAETTNDAFNLGIAQGVAIDAGVRVYGLSGEGIRPSLTFYPRRCDDPPRRSDDSTGKD